jgi:hypothetical protein
MQSELSGKATSEFLFAPARGINASDPVIAWGILLQPSEGGGEEELSSRFDQGGGTIKKCLGIGESADQICGQNDVIVAEGGGKVGGILNGEGDAAAVDLLGDDGIKGKGDITLSGTACSVAAIPGKSLRGRDERL